MQKRGSKGYVSMSILNELRSIVVVLVLEMIRGRARVRGRVQAAAVKDEAEERR